jgi:hypothetical protein
MAFPNENGNRYNMHYTAEEAEMVDKAKRVHRETTASADRALKVATRAFCSQRIGVKISSSTQFAGTVPTWVLNRVPSFGCSSFLALLR